MALVQERSRERAQRFVGRTMEVLVGGTEPNRPDPTSGSNQPQQDRQLRGCGPARRAGRRRHRAPPPRPRSPGINGSSRAPCGHSGEPVNVLAIFGPTGVGKTAIAIAVAESLRARGEDPVALSCDAIQVYRGLETLSGAATARERNELEHRLLGFVDPGEEFSAGRFAALAHAEVDGLLAEGRRPIVVGGTGLYLRAALADLDLRPPVPAGVRTEVEREIADRGPGGDPRRARPADGRSGPSSRPQAHRAVARAPARGARPASRQRPALDGERPPSDDSGRPRHGPAGARVAHRRAESTRCSRSGARDEARSAVETGASRTARAALGFDEFLAGDSEGVKRAHRAYARRQLTWMRKMPGLELIDRTGLDESEVAVRIVALLGEPGGE